MVVACNIAQCPHNVEGCICVCKFLAIENGTCKELIRLQQGKEPMPDDKYKTNNRG